MPIFNKRSKSSNIDCLKEFGSETVHKKDISNAMNSLFCPVGKDLADKLDPAPNPLLAGDYEINKHKATFHFRTIEVQEITSGVSQGSILGPLLFNIYINDLLLCIEKSGICNFADDNTLYASGENIGDVATCLEVDIENVLKWFDSNRMVANPEKFQVMFLGLPKTANICIEIDDLVLVPKDNVKLLGITIDSELKFTDHVKSLCAKTSRKVTAFSRVAKLLDFKKARLLYNAFILSSLSYCPLIWMFCGKTSNREINRIHKRALRILFNDYEASFEELLQRNNEQTVHTKNLHKLMTEVYKSLNRQNPAFMLDLFIRKEVTYDLRVKDLLELPTARTVLNGLNSIVFRGSILWNAISDEIKSSQSIASFKRKIKSWNGDDCNCNICN